MLPTDFLWDGPNSNIRRASWDKYWGDVFACVLLDKNCNVELANRADVEAVVIFEDVFEVGQRQRGEVLA